MAGVKSKTSATSKSLNAKNCNSSKSRVSTSATATKKAPKIKSRRTTKKPGRSDKTSSMGRVMAEKLADVLAEQEDTQQQLLELAKNAAAESNATTQASTDKATTKAKAKSKAKASPSRKPQTTSATKKRTRKPAAPTASKAVSPKRSTQAATKRKTPQASADESIGSFFTNEWKKTHASSPTEAAEPKQSTMCEEPMRQSLEATVATPSPVAPAAPKPTVPANPLAMPISESPEPSATTIPPAIAEKYDVRNISSLEVTMLANELFITDCISREDFAMLSFQPELQPCYETVGAQGVARPNGARKRDLLAEWRKILEQQRINNNSFFFTNHSQKIITLLESIEKAQNR